MGRSALALVLAFAAIHHIAAFGIQRTVLATEEQVLAHHGEVVALNLAESGVEMALGRLAFHGSWRGWQSSDAPGGGRVVAGAFDDTTLGPLGVQVVSYGSFLDWADTVRVRLLIDHRMPGAARGAVTANGVVAGAGGMIFDGRDHDLNGNVVPGDGALAISTMATLDLRPNTWLAGTSDGLDHPLRRATDGDLDYDAITETGASWPAGVPFSPDGAMGGEAAGYPEGSLKQIAKSGVNGSQYVGLDTSPPTGPDDLTLPFRGVTYVEPAIGQAWINARFDDDCSGILVVHNESGTGFLKNVNHGVFRGLIIADDLVHVHTQVIGAIIVLTGRPSSGNLMGNGSGSVLYSRAALSRASSGMPGVYSPLDIVGWHYR